MSGQTVLEVAAPNSVAQEFEGEIIALNLEKGTYYSLRGLSSIVWRDLAAGHPVEALVALASGQPNGAEQMEAFIAKIREEGLMRRASGSPTVTTPPDFAAALAKAGAVDLVFERYDDMNSLILLDPVHEVDETRGWPNLPPSRG